MTFQDFPGGVGTLLLEKLTKPAQLTKLQTVVAVALRECVKTFRLLRNLQP